MIDQEDKPKWDCQESGSSTSAPTILVSNETSTRPETKKGQERPIFPLLFIWISTWDGFAMCSKVFDTPFKSRSFFSSTWVWVGLMSHRSDCMWLPRLHYKRCHGFLLALLLGSFLREASCQDTKWWGHPISPLEGNWGLYQEPCGWAIWEPHFRPRQAFRWLQPWLTSWLPPHESPWAKTAQLSCSWLIETMRW